MASQAIVRFSKSLLRAGRKWLFRARSGHLRISSSLILCSAIRRIVVEHPNPAASCENRLRPPNEMTIHLKARTLRTFQSRLLAWFRAHRRELPWRESRDWYRVWVAEIMLQQTRIAAVVPYYDRFLRRFPNVEFLAR